MADYIPRQQSKKTAAANIVNNLRSALQIAQHAQLEYLFNLVPSMHTQVTSMLAKIEKWVNLVERSNLYISLSELQSIERSSGRLNEKLVSILDYDKDTDVTALVKKKLEIIDEACSDFEAHVSVLTLAFLYSHGVEEYVTISENVLNQQKTLRNEHSQVLQQLKEKELLIRHREDEIAKVVETASHVFDRDNQRLKRRFITTSVVLVLLLVTMFVNVYMWASNPEWLFPREFSGDPVRFYYHAMTTKVTVSVLLIALLVITIRLFKSYLNMLEYNTHRINLLRTLQPIALASPVSMRDEIYARIIETVTHYDRLDESPKGGTVESLAKVLRSIGTK